MGCNIETSFFAFPFGLFFLKTWDQSPLEHGERFHQDIFQMDKRYSGLWSPNMLADCSWSLIRETPTGKYERQKKKM